MSAKKIVKFFMTEDNLLIEQMFYEFGYVPTKDFLEADLVVFTGGADVPADWAGYPEVYKDLEKEHLWKTKEHKRCMSEKFYYSSAMSRRKTCVGICRGAQILWTFNGGKLWYDVDGHKGDHDVYLTTKGLPLSDYKNMMCSRTLGSMRVTSTHHQMCMTGHDSVKFPYFPLAVANETLQREPWDGPRRTRSKDYVKNGAAWHHVIMDLEAYYIPSTRCFATQFHPEYHLTGNKPDMHTLWFFETLEEILEAQDAIDRKEAAKEAS